VGRWACADGKRLADPERNLIEDIAGTIGQAVTHQDDDTEDLASSLDPCLASGVVTLDQRGLITRWNSAAERRFGWTERDVLGKPLPILTDERCDGFAR